LNLNLIQAKNCEINKTGKFLGISCLNYDDDELALSTRIAAMGCGVTGLLGSLVVAVAGGLAPFACLAAASAGCLAAHKYSLKWSSWVDPENYERMGLGFTSIYSDTNEIEDLDLRTVYAKAKSLVLKGRVHCVEALYVNAVDKPEDAQELPHPTFIGPEMMVETRAVGYDAYYHGQPGAWVQQRQFRLFVHDELLLELLQKFRNNTEELGDRFKRMEDDLVRMASPFEIDRYSTVDILADTLLLAKLILKYRYSKDLLDRRVSRTDFH
jgi:hypothetical protein